MFNRMYKTGFNWCFKYGKGASLVLFVGLFLEITKQLINKYFGIDVDGFFLLESFSLSGGVIFCFTFLVQSWVNLEFLNYIYKGENEEKHGFSIFNNVKPYIIPAFLGSFILNLIMIVPTIFMSVVGEMASLSKGSAKGFWFVLLIVFLLFVLPLVIILSLRLSFYLEVIIVNSIKDPILALKESFKITKGRVWDIIRILILPVLLITIVVIVLAIIIQKTDCFVCDYAGLAGAIVHPLLVAVSFALYLEFKKNPIREPENKDQVEE
ncbi:MAG: hypothetical protein U9Q34_08275 [Elusimicrobiota bacterium]|nr:hypothetical protein [Elusimicrobiota bacterium]